MYVNLLAHQSRWTELFRYYVSKNDTIDVCTKTEQQYKANADSNTKHNEESTLSLPPFWCVSRGLRLCFIIVPRSVNMSVLLRSVHHSICVHSFRIAFALYCVRFVLRSLLFCFCLFWSFAMFALTYQDSLVYRDEWVSKFAHTLKTFHNDLTIMVFINDLCEIETKK